MKINEKSFTSEGKLKFLKKINGGIVSCESMSENISTMKR